MWIIVFFDLPVGTKKQRGTATRFRNFLKDDGYVMLQYSVYARVCRAEDGASKHLGRVLANLPKEGSVRSLQITDRQYEKMRVLLGRATSVERAAREQMVLL